LSGWQGLDRAQPTAVITQTPLASLSLLCAQCLKYKTDQLVDVKRMEKLNNLMFLLMSRGASASLGAPTLLCCIGFMLRSR